ncbi:GNAT family N-acetyltransferase [Demequina rhizosphaerae]|uniref:GNAT family N-acetyltransferase n=1 Tax=Demequina rhizosphaerae TaxID=1638985 RepID=UPI00078073EF|nr:GNAT family N-acetyltransferase [Demequina rhizosphaerae]
MTATLVRRATVDDAPAIAHVHLQSWRETYGPVLPADVLAGLDLDARTARWQAILDEGRSTIHVAVAGGEVVGFASAGDRPDEGGPAPRELEGLYVLARHHGTGEAARLLAEAVGHGPAYLWVWRNNARAIAFYAKHGFVPDGAEDTHTVSGHPIPAIRMVRT